MGGYKNYSHEEMEESYDVVHIIPLLVPLKFGVYRQHCLLKVNGNLSLYYYWSSIVCFPVYPEVLLQPTLIRTPCL